MAINHSRPGSPLPARITPPRRDHPRQHLPRIPLVVRHPRQQHLEADAVGQGDQGPCRDRVRAVGEAGGEVVGPLGGDRAQGGAAQGGEIELVLQLDAGAVAAEPVAEDTGEVGGEVTAGTVQRPVRGDRLGEALAGLAQRGDHQLVEALEVVRRRTERHIGLGGGTAVAEPREALLADDPDGRVDDPLRRSGS